MRTEVRLHGLYQLLNIDVSSLNVAAAEAVRLVARLTGADKVDIFLYQPASRSLFAVATNDSPMGRRQHAVGLDWLPLAMGGRAVQVF
jgi:hypothetical protein